MRLAELSGLSAGEICAPLIIPARLRHLVATAMTFATPLSRMYEAIIPGLWEIDGIGDAVHCYLWEGLRG